jgi:hypothetical protein
MAGKFSIGAFVTRPRKVETITRITFSLTAAWATSAKRGMMSYFLSLWVSVRIGGRSQRHGLIDLFSNVLLESQQPKTERDLIAHLGTRFMFNDIYQTGKTISWDKSAYYPHTLELSGESPRRPCAPHVGEEVLLDIGRQVPACEGKMRSRMTRGY